MKSMDVFIREWMENQLKKCRKTQHDFYNKVDNCICPVLDERMCCPPECTFEETIELVLEVMEKANDRNR